MTNKRALIVFAKAPRLGHVKTRLAVDLGDEGALNVYRQMAEGIWAKLRQPQAQGAFSLWLCFDPPEAEPQIRLWLKGADRYLPQVPGNLGHRLASALESAFSAGYREAGVMGTDAPSVTPVCITEAFDQLGPGRIVLGPSMDGGFYLMALSHPVSNLGKLLDEIPWSSADTLATLIGRAGCLGLDVRLMPEARDIDTVSDLEAYRLSPAGVACPLGDPLS